MFLMNGENFYHIGSLVPNLGMPPKFAQMYIYDIENEIRNRIFVVRYVILNYLNILSFINYKYVN